MERLLLVDGRCHVDDRSSLFREACLKATLWVGVTEYPDASSGAAIEASSRWPYPHAVDAEAGHRSEIDSMVDGGVLVSLSMLSSAHEEAVVPAAVSPICDRLEGLSI